MAEEQRRANLLWALSDLTDEASWLAISWRDWEVRALFQEGSWWNRDSDGNGDVVKQTISRGNFALHVHLQNLKSGAVKDDKNIQPFANYLRKVQIHSLNRSFPRCCCRPYFFVDPHIPTESICSAVFRKHDQFRVWLNTSFKVFLFVLMYHAMIKDLKSLFNVRPCHQTFGVLFLQERHKQGNEKAPLLCHVNKARHVSTLSQELFEDSWSSFVYTWYWKEASENSYNKLSRAQMRLLALIFPCHQSWNLFIISPLLFAKNGKFEP